MGMEQAGHCERELVLRSTREVRDAHHREDSSVLHLLNSLVHSLPWVPPCPTHHTPQEHRWLQVTETQIKWGREKLTRWFRYLRRPRVVQPQACWSQVLRNLFLSLKPELCFPLRHFHSLDSYMVGKLAYMVITAHHLRRGGIIPLAALTSNPKKK